MISFETKFTQRNIQKDVDLAMIENYTLQHEGRQYVWCYDPQTPSPRDCWGWARADQSQPNSALSQRLSAVLINEHLKSMIERLEPNEYQRLAGILRWMGCQPHHIAPAKVAGLCLDKAAALSGFIGIHWRLSGSNGHHRVYVVELREEARNNFRVHQSNQNASTEMPCVYVGLTGLAAEERLQKHLAGEKSSWYVRTFGVGLLPHLAEGLYGMPYDEARVVESELAVELRRQGYVVTGGH